MLLHFAFGDPAGVQAKFLLHKGVGVGVKVGAVVGVEVGPELPTGVGVRSAELFTNEQFTSPPRAQMPCENPCGVQLDKDNNEQSVATETRLSLPEKMPNH